jgi:hypothetical protein
VKYVFFSNLTRKIDLHYEIDGSEVEKNRACDQMMVVSDAINVYMMV